MTSGIKIVIYPVKDLARARAPYRALLGVDPFANSNVTGRIQSP